MVQLRHLQVDRGIYLPNPLPDDKLEEANELVMRNLHTLLIVKNFTMSEEICKRVPNIKELQLKYYGKVRSYYCPHNLVLLRKLESLDLHIYNDDSGWREYGVSLTFPSSLKELSLSGCRLDWEEIGAIPTLRSIVLIDCSVSLAISAVRMLVEQEEDHGNEGLTLYVHFSIDEEKQKCFNKKMEEEGLTPNNLYLE